MATVCKNSSSAVRSPLTSAICAAMHCCELISPLTHCSSMRRHSGSANRSRSASTVSVGATVPSKSMMKSMKVIHDELQIGVSPRRKRDFNATCSFTCLYHMNSAAAAIPRQRPTARRRGTHLSTEDVQSLTKFAAKAAADPGAPGELISESASV